MAWNYGGKPQTSQNSTRSKEPPFVLLLSSFCLLEWGEGSSPALPESRQTFEVAAAQTSRRINRVFSRQTVFFFVCELLLIDKPMVTSELAVTSAQLLGLGSKLYHSNMQHMLN